MHVNVKNFQDFLPDNTVCLSEGQYQEPPIHVLTVLASVPGLLFLTTQFIAY